MADSRPKSQKGSYITFLMNGECYAISVAKVTELLEMVPVTRVPRMPDFVRGVINLRGEVVTVVDCRVKFGLPAIADTIETCMVVMSVVIDDKSVKVGVVVDSVSEVIEIEDSNILPLPSLGKLGVVESIIGVIKSEDKITMVLDVDQEFQKDLAVLTQVQLTDGIV